MCLHGNHVSTTFDSWNPGITIAILSPWIACFPPWKLESERDFISLGGIPSNKDRKNKQNDLKTKNTTRHYHNSVNVKVIINTVAMEIVKHELPPEGSWESSLSKLLIDFVGIRLTPGPSEKHTDMLNGYYVCKKKHYSIWNSKHFLQRGGLPTWGLWITNLVKQVVQFNFNKNKIHPPTHAKDLENEINHSLEMWFKIENYSRALQNLKKKINIPLFQERERERKREQESNKGHYQLLLHLYNDNE